MRVQYTLAFVLGLAVLQAQNTFFDATDALGFTPEEGSYCVTVGDFNNDGWDDVYIGFPKGKNQLWKNMGTVNGTEEVVFTDITDQAGVGLFNQDTKTALWMDLDNDDDLDLYVCNRNNPDVLYRNNGDETFTNMNSTAGIFNLGHPLSLNAADVDADGDLDIYISNFFAQNILYRNNGDWTFTDVTLQSGAVDIREAMGSIFFDYDKDGDQDLYMVHDNYTPNILYENDGTGKFTNVAAVVGVDCESFGMGVDVGDINQDGWLDIYVTNIYKNFLMLCNGPDSTGQVTFTRIEEAAGVDDFGMGWGCTMLDFDNDAWVDLYAVNEYKFAPYPNVLYRNNGDLTFTIVEDSSVVSNKKSSYGTAAVDVDLDGQMDLMVANTHVGERFEVYKNPDRGNHWIGLKLIGTNSNRQAIGAVVEITDDLGTLHYDQTTAGNGWTSQNSNLIHFGLGSATQIQNAIIRWPSGLVQPISGLVADHYFTVLEGQEPVFGVNDGTVSIFENNAPKAAFSVFPNPSDGQFFVHFENEERNPVSVEVKNQLGQRIFQQKTQSNGTFAVDLKGNAKAQTVFVSVLTAEGIVTKKVLLR